MSKHTLNFFPLGNADTTLISLENGQHILWDYANMKDKSDSEDKRCDLPFELDQVVDDGFAVVTFTHADKDHINMFSEYFYLEHAKKYQNESRKRINELWVPATVLIDTHAEEEAKVLKAEARYRLKHKNGILVFSRPEKMKEWCDDQDDISYDEVKHLFVDAGSMIPGFSKEENGIEFFVHAPFVSESQEIDRNGASIVIQATFNDRCETKVILGGDSNHEVWSDIVKITKYYNNEDRLKWDFFHVSHHCSYLALGSEKGEDKTVPDEDISWLYETQGNSNCRVISPSKPIPAKGSDEDKDNNPPHRQAAAYYKEVVSNKSGEFLVTMEHPNESSPEIIIVEIDQSDCAKLLKKTIASAAYIGSATAPRAGQL